MTKKVQIKNFKSIRDLEIDLGKFNVLIGSNGSGKSNILEAIAMGGAASAGMLKREFLVSRGVRINSDPKLMRSGFDRRFLKQPIEIVFEADKDKGKNIKYVFVIQHDNKPFSEWMIINKEDVLNKAQQVLAGLFGNNKFNLEKLLGAKFKKDEQENLLKAKELFNSMLSQEASESEKDRISKKVRDALKTFVVKKIDEEYYNKEIANFIVYSPEISSLRKFDDEGQIEPLGIKGEGLYNLLSMMDQGKEKKKIKIIKDHLRLIEWYIDFSIPHRKSSVASKEIMISDKYIDTKNVALTQYSSNEGFLLLLFYLTLFVSEKTPEFFAIDNIEASFNPKLCKKIVEVLVKLSKHFHKQVILTTHNPAILDGLNIRDEEQRLFTVSRNLNGHTIVFRNELKEKMTKQIPLSIAWQRGYLGALPDNF